MRLRRTVFCAVLLAFAALLVFSVFKREFAEDPNNPVGESSPPSLKVSISRLFQMVETSDQLTPSLFFGNAELQKEQAEVFFDMHAEMKKRVPDAKFTLEFFVQDKELAIAGIGYPQLGKIEIDRLLFVAIDGKWRAILPWTAFSKTPIPTYNDQIAEVVIGAQTKRLQTLTKEYEAAYKSHLETQK